MAVYDVDTDGGGTYSTLSAAEAALPATPTEIDYITLEGSAVDTTQAAFAGYNRTSEFPLIVTGAAAGKEYTISAHEPIKSDSPYITFKDFNVNVASVGTYGQGVNLRASNITLDGLNITRSGTVYADNRGIAQNTSLTGLIIQNCVISGFDGTSSVGAYLRSATAFNNNTISNCTRNVRFSDSVVTMNNCVAINNVSGYDYSANTLVAGSNNASGDSSAPGTSPTTSVPYTTATFVNVTGGSEDFHLADTDSVLYHAGSPVSGLVYDFDGETWDASTPSVGAYEYPTATGPELTSISSDDTAPYGEDATVVGTNLDTATGFTVDSIDKFSDFDDGDGSTGSWQLPSITDAQQANFPEPLTALTVSITDGVTPDTLPFTFTAPSGKQIVKLAGTMNSTETESLVPHESAFTPAADDYLITDSNCTGGATPAITISAADGTFSFDYAEGTTYTFKYQFWRASNNTLYASGTVTVQDGAIVSGSTKAGTPSAGTSSAAISGPDTGTCGQSVHRF